MNMVINVSMHFKLSESSITNTNYNVIHEHHAKFRYPLTCLKLLTDTPEALKYKSD
jgi:hypothetical protein